MLRGEVTPPLSANLLHQPLVSPAAEPAALLDEDPLVAQLLFNPSALRLEP